jgi:hemoglobin-like flavoprotein
MTPKQVALVQVSWERVIPLSEDAAQLFYDRLFSLDPALKPLFRGDMKDQGRKLMNMIGFAVKGLTRLDAIAPGLQALGRRHAGYGVQDSHYDTVAHALLWTLSQGLGQSFTGEVREAWSAAYGVLANTMKDAAKVAA